MGYVTISNLCTNFYERSGFDPFGYLGVPNGLLASFLSEDEQQKGKIMIRTFQHKDLNTVMQIWLDTNIQTHTFIPPNYWNENFETVKNMLPKAELYVYENENTSQIDGFIGLTDNYIAGIFVRKTAQSNGIGKQLLDYVKKRKSNLSLSVYQKNTHAIRFYQRESFVFQSENTDDSTKEKEFIMVWKQAAPPATAPVFQSVP